MIITLKEVPIEKTKDILETAEAENVFVKSRHDLNSTIYEITLGFKLDNSFHTYLVLDEDNKTVGFISAFPNKDSDTTSLGIMYILPEARGKGYGKAMVQEYIKLYSEKGYKKVFTKTWESNIGSQRIFTELGFEVIEKKENDRVNGDATIRLLLNIKDTFQ